MGEKCTIASSNAFLPAFRCRRHIRAQAKVIQKSSTFPRAFQFKFKTVLAYINMN